MTRPLCGPIHVAILAFWLSAVVCAGATAAVVFPTMKGLDPTLPAFAQYTGPHWMVAAGHVGATVFRGLDIAAYVCLPLAILTAAGARFASRPLSLFRWGLIVVLCGLVAYQVGVLHPAMFRELGPYWEAARAGDNAAAERHQAAFTAMHPTSTRLLGGLALTLLGLLVLAVLSAGRGMACRAGPGAGEPPSGR